MQTNVQGINNFFSALGSAFAGPNAMDIARASVLGSQRGLYEAQTRNQGLLGDRMEGQTAARQGLQSIDWADPAARARAPGLVFGGYDNPAQVIPALTGATVFTDPNAWNRNDYSNVLVGTGVVPNYASTPTGLDQTLANQRETTANPTKLPFSQLDELSQQVEPRLLNAFMAAYPDAGITPDVMDPSLLALATDLAAQNYGANGGNGQTAIADAIAQIMADKSIYQVDEAYDAAWYNPMDWLTWQSDTPASVRLRPQGLAAPNADQAAAPTPAEEAAAAAKGPSMADIMAGEFGGAGGGADPSMFQTFPANPAAEGIGQPAVQQAQAAAANPAVDPRLGALEGQRVTLKDGRTGTIKNGKFFADGG